MLGLASCQTEPEGLNVNVGGEVDTTITVTIPDTETRAGGNNSAVGAFDNVDWNEYTIRYIFEVYYGETGVQKQVYYTDDMTASFPVRLVPGRDYNFVAWADIVPQANVTETNKALPYDNNVVENHYDADDLNAITLNDTWVAMDETRDAYSGFHNTNGGEKYTGSSSINIRMTRPFAKLRVITTDMNELKALGITPVSANVTYSVFSHQSFNALNGTYSEQTITEEHIYKIANYADQTGANKVLFTDYFFADDNDVVKFELDVYEGDVNNQTPTTLIKHNDFKTDIPAQRNYLTTIQGNVLTDGNNITVTVEHDGAFAGNENVEWKEVNNAQEINEVIEELNDPNSTTEEVHIVLGQDIDLNDLFSTTRAADTTDPSLTIKSGKTLSIDLGGKKLSAVTNIADNNGDGQIRANEDNQFIFNVLGTLSILNGTIEYKHKGENMGWNAATSIFNVTAGGVLNLEGVTAKNLGGSDMGFVAHLNNWGEVTLNVDNCTLESNYVAVRVFNSGPDMNNVTIKNSTLKGVSAAFWVHNYTVEDFGTEAKAEAQKALLNFDILDQSNTFSPIVGIRYGFTNSIRFDSYGIARTVSEDGTIVTLDKFFGEGVVRRGVAGAEENSTITKAVVGEGITTLYDRTFRRFYALEEVVLPSTLTTIGAEGSGVFQSCTNLKSIVIPESVTVLGKGSFQECSSLESINIPAGVTRIEADALRATGLKSVEFHEGVTYFGAQAFRDCKQLKEVIINAPEFTMEGNTFGIMAAPFTPMTIYVANAEMKAYVESKLTDHAKTYITVVAPKVVASTDDLKAALTTDAKMVSVAKGEYTFPSSSVKAGQTIICEKGTVFTGKSSLNINGATVIGAEFKNENGTAVSGTIYGNFKNCTFTGSEALRWCYSEAGKTTVFENCVIKTDFRGFHYDGMKGDVIFRNCEINGFNAYSGDGTVTFEGCTFGCDKSRYNGLNIYSNTNIVNCTFNYVSGKTNFIDMEGTGKTLTITNCTATLDGAAAKVADFVGGSKLAENKVIIK